MLARLWWKEYRVLGPVWLMLALVSPAFQWLIMWVMGKTTDPGSLMIAALAWGALYAFAAGAAAFAGERESNTLGFLDALPVGRGALWLGKVSFAMASTLALAVFLAGVATLGAVTLPTPGHSRVGGAIATLGPILFEAVAWGLFWSALSRNALLAGAMAVVSVGASAMISTRLVDSLFPIGPSGVDSARIVAARLILATLALAGSAPGIAWRPAWRGRIREGSESTRGGPIAIRAASTARSLAWQAWREGRTTWVLVGVVGLVIPVGSAILDTPYDGLLDVLMIAIAALIAGVGVFGTEDVPGSRRFLAHHGVGPGSVWWRRFLVWGVGMSSFLGLTLLAFFAVAPRSRMVGQPVERLGLFVLTPVNAFLVGMICGMAIRRRITAALVGVMVLVVLVPLQLGLLSAEMVPAWSFVLVPLVLAGISRAWAADWLLEREGARPWARLGGLVAVPAGLLFAAFIAYRAFGVPDVGPQFDEATLRASDVPPDQDAAEAYRRVVGLIRGNMDLFGAMTDVGRDADKPEVINFWMMVIEMTRKASTMPRARFATPGPMTKVSEEAARDGRRPRQPAYTDGLDLVELLIATDAGKRRAKGDLPGAWDDILAQFRMANQLATSTPSLAQMRLAIQFHHRAVALAFDWLGDPRQTPETTRRALADLKALPTLPDLAEAMRVESLIIERTLDQSGDVLADLLLTGEGDARPSTFDYLLFAKVEAAPWERRRARRVWRRLVAEEIPIVGDEPWQRPRYAEWRFLEDPDYSNSKMIRWLMPSFSSTLMTLDRERTGRRALEQAIALVAWKLDHAGEYPSKLEDLVPGLLAKLPPDPFSGRPFGYVRSNGREITSPLSEALRTTRPGQPLLYSAGSDRADDGGRTAYGSAQYRDGDYVYIVP